MAKKVSIRCNRWHKGKSYLEEVPGHRYGLFGVTQSLENKRARDVIHIPTGRRVMMMDSLNYRVWYEGLTPLRAAVKVCKEIGEKFPEAEWHTAAAETLTKREPELAWRITSYLSGPVLLITSASDDLLLVGLRRPDYLGSKDVVDGKIIFTHKSLKVAQAVARALYIHPTLPAFTDLIFRMDDHFHIVSLPRVDNHLQTRLLEGFRRLIINQLPQKEQEEYDA